MHRSTLDGNLRTRPTPVHLAVTASMKQGGIIYATAGICWYCRPGSNGSGSGGTKRVTEGLGGARQDIQGKRYRSASCGSAVEDDLLESVASQAQLVTIT